jgi:hypothetical protein
MKLIAKRHEAFFLFDVGSRMGRVYAERRGPLLRPAQPMEDILAEGDWVAVDDIEPTRRRLIEDAAEQLAELEPS